MVFEYLKGNKESKESDGSEMSEKTIISSLISDHHYDEEEDLIQIGIKTNLTIIEKSNENSLKSNKLD